MVEHALPGSTHMGLLANNIKWMGGFPPYPPKIEKNWKPESHAEEAHCSVHVILFTALSATPSTFNSLSNILFISPLSPGRASTKSSLSTMLVFMVTLGMVFIPNGWSSPVSKNQLADGWHPKISQGWKVSSCRVFLRIYAYLCFMSGMFTSQTVMISGIQE